MLEKVCTPIGFSEGVKQGYPVSSTLVSLYIYEIFNYIERLDGSRAYLTGVAMSISLYSNDIVLISEDPEGLESHLNALKSFCIEKSLLVDLDKPEVIVFYTSQAWVTRSEQLFFLGEPVAYT